MNISTAWRTCLKTKLFNLEDRASRSEFWWFTLLVVPIHVALSYWFTFYLSVKDQIYLMFFIPVSLVLSIAWYSVGVRRLHDLNINGLWAGFGITSFLILTYITSITRCLEDLTYIDTWGVLFLTMAIFGVAGIIGIVYLILFVTMGTIGNNRYGPDPLEKQHLELINRLYAMQNMTYPAHTQSQIPGTTNPSAFGPGICPNVVGANSTAFGPGTGPAAFGPGSSSTAPNLSAGLGALYGMAQAPATYRNRSISPEQEAAIQKVCGDPLFEDTLSSPYRNPSPMGSYQESLDQAKKVAQNTAELNPQIVIHADHDSATSNQSQSSNTISQTDYGSFTYTATNEQANTYTPPSGITVDGSFYPASAPVTSNQAASLDANSTQAVDSIAAESMAAAPIAADSTAAAPKSTSSATATATATSAGSSQNAPDESELSLDKTPPSTQDSSKETHS